MANARLTAITELFEKQIGVREKPTNNVIYNTHYYGYEVSGAQYPWCCAFIWDVFRMAGASDLFCGGDKTAYCPYVVDWAKKNSRWTTKVSAYRPGDLFLYDWNGDGVADHIGFCVDWDGEKKTGHAIEGNTSGSGGDGVYKVARSSKQILGAYRPKYSAEPPASTAPSTDTPSDDDHDTYIVQYGDSMWAIAERFLGAGIKYPEIMELNGMKEPRIYPGDVLKIPGVNDRKTYIVTTSAATRKYLQSESSRTGKTLGEIIDELVDYYTKPIFEEETK